MKRIRQLCASLVPLLVMCGVLASWGSARAQDVSTATLGRQIILFQVSSPPDTTLRELGIELDRIGERKTIMLRDDGMDPADFANDGVFVGRDSGAYARYVGVRLFAVSDRPSETLYAGVLRTSDERSVSLAWQVRRQESGYVAYRTVSAYPGQVFAMEEAIPLIAAFGWAFFVLFFVMGMAGFYRREPKP